MAKCTYRLFGPGANTTCLVADLRVRDSDFQGPNNDPAAILAERSAVADAICKRNGVSDLACDLIQALALDRLLPSVDPPLVRVAGSLRALTQAGESDPSAQIPSPTQFSRCPYLKLAISTSGSSIDRIIIDADSAVTIPAEHVCVELLGPADWFHPNGQGTLPTPWDVLGVVRICRVWDSVEVFGRLTEFQPVAPATSVTMIVPRGTRRAWFFGLPVLQVWQLFAGDPAAGGVVVGTARVPADTVGALEFVPGISHIRNLPFASDVQVGFTWEIAPL